MTTRTPVKTTRTFTAADHTDIQTYDSDFADLSGAGAGWLTVESNKLTVRFGTNFVFIYRDGVGTYSADQYASADLAGSGAANDVRYGVVVRASADTGAGMDWYAAIWDANTSPLATKVLKCVNGTVSTLDSRTGISWANGDTMSLEAVTNGGACELTVFKNGVSQYMISDSSTPLTSGKPGIYLRDNGGGAIGSMDNLELGTVTSGGGGGAATGAAANYYSNLLRA